MTWTAPAVERSHEPVSGPERPMLEGLLEWHRATLLGKCSGLTGEQLVRRAAPPSPLTLLGLVRHMADVERAWFRRRLRGADLDLLYDPDAEDLDFHEADPRRAEEDLRALLAEMDRAREAAAAVALDDTFQHPRRGECSLRWVYLHMIEEYARHNGHADLLRERIDGVTGT